MDSEYPKLFISYSWDSENHKAWVRQLATDLQNNGVYVYLDQWDTYPGKDIPNYLETCIRECEYVLLICTHKFQDKANVGKGGVGYEKNIVTGEIWSGSSDRKYIPIIKGDPEKSLPSYLKSKIYVDFRNEGKYQENIEELLRHIYDSPKYSRPLLGKKPDFSKRQIIDVENKQIDITKSFNIEEYKEVYDFAYSFGGMNMSRNGAASWANDFMEKFGFGSLEGYKEVYDFAYSFGGMNMSRSAAASWANDFMEKFGLDNLGEFREAYNFAYSFGGLNMSRNGALEWALEKLKSN